MVEAEVDVEEGWAREVEDRWEDEADILESYRVYNRFRIAGNEDSWPTLLNVVVAWVPYWTASRGHVSAHHSVHQFIAQRSSSQDFNVMNEHPNAEACSLIT